MPWRRWWCGLFCLLAAAGAVADSGAAGPELELVLWPEQARLEGHFRVELQYLDAASPVRFRLDPGIAVDAVELDGQALAYTRSDDGWLELTQSLAAVDGTLVIRYGARLSDAPRGARGGGYLGAEGGFLPPGADWYPRRPAAEPHPFRVDLDVMDGHLGVASGSRVTEDHAEASYRATFEHPGGRALAVATGPWEPVTQAAGEVEIRTLFPAALEAGFGELYRNQAAAYIERFSDELGAYPFSTFTIAASPQPVGLAFSGFTLLGTQVIPLPFIPYTSLGHEVLHSWWGTSVYVDPADGNWSEGLTTFLADYQFKREAGEARAERGQWLRDYAALPATEDRPHGTFRGGNAGAARIAGYHRGAMLWLMLEDWIGREALLAGTRELYAQWRFREADWDALIATFDREADADLRPFFDQWIGRSGAPLLELTQVQRESAEAGWQLRAQLHQRSPGEPWKLRVPLGLKTEDGQETHWVELEQEGREVVIETDARPLAVAVDPDWRLFRHLAAEESPDILRRAALDPQTRLIALGDASAEEVASWLGRLPDPAERDQGTRILLGDHEATRRWLAERGFPGHPATVKPGLDVPPGPRAWMVPGAAVVVISGADAAARREVVGALRHRSHYSYLLPGQDDAPTTGLWPVPGVWQELNDDE
ncbi:M1 family metallopeptidase [Thioalkalivibrio sp. ALJT]|uniref:M1 family metallopeptidase n=1 Tax=Thioalkalivibrio sp. ALJT TaxID=1158146 RepID=UPI0003A2F73A|nr:aminopeptidase N [Thioalkalivibrio sp. ALJT]